MPTVDVHKVAAFLNVTPRRIQQLVKEGMPRGTRGQYDPFKCGGWCVRYLRGRSIGKESDSWENVDGGMVHSEQKVYTDYAGPRRTEWIVKVQPALRKPKLEVLIEACGKRLCRREIIELRAGRKKPHRTTQHLLESILKRLGFL